MFLRDRKVPGATISHSGGSKGNSKTNPMLTYTNLPERCILKEINQMLQASVLLPVTTATLWINSFVLIEKRGNHGQVKL